MGEPWLSPNEHWTMEASQRFRLLKNHPSVDFLPGSKDGLDSTIKVGDSHQSIFIGIYLTRMARVSFLFLWEGGAIHGTKLKIKEKPSPQASSVFGRSLWGAVLLFFFLRGYIMNFLVRGHLWLFGGCKSL